MEPELKDGGQLTQNEPDFDIQKYHDKKEKQEQKMRAGFETPKKKNKKVFMYNGFND